MIFCEIYPRLVLKIRKVSRNQNLILRQCENSRRRDLPAGATSSGVKPSIYFNR